MSWRYVEPCCGSASVALALLGARRPLLPYQGSKWRFRHSILARFQECGFEGLPRRIDLVDIGPWGIVAPCVVEPRGRQGVIDQLAAMGRSDPREVYAALHQQLVPADPVSFSAQFLFLQRLAYSGKAVGDRGGRWASPGFNSSSAYGLPGTDRFGAVKPMIPSLIAVLEGYADLSVPERLHGARESAPGPDRLFVEEPTLIYIDPPYAGATGYPGGDLDREGVVTLAEAWRGAGAAVMVSEAAPIDALVERGWSAVHLDDGRRDTSRFRGKQEEWLTVWRSPPR